MMPVLAKDLRAAVLQAAIQGKLTQQLPEDGDASDLLAIINAEKEQLIKDKKIKKEKPLVPVEDDDIPFDIPNNWEWVKLGTISSYAQTKEKASKEDKASSIWSLDLEDIEKDSGKILNFVSAKNRKITGDKTKFYKGQVLYSKLRPYLLKILVAPEDGICTSEIIPFSLYGNIYSEYIVKYLRSPYVDQIINAVTYGVKMPRVGTDTMTNLLIPLPPLAEQHRIVARVEELMSLIDEYEKIENQLTELKEKFPGDMKAGLLQAAMQGKLTKQLSTDTLVSFNEDEFEEVPFDIPNSWHWCKFGNITDRIVGKTPPRSEVEWWKNDVSWVSIADMPESGHLSSTKEGVSKKALNEKFKDRISPAGTLLMSFKLTIGRVSILDIDAVHNEAIISVFPKKDVNNIFRDYLFKILPLMSQYGDDKNAIKGKTLNKDSIFNIPIPVPPIEEQQRIVDILDKLLPMCDELTE